MDNRVLRALKSRTKSLCFDKCSLRELPTALGRLDFLHSLSAKNNSLRTLPEETSRLVEVSVWAPGSSVAVLAKPSLSAVLDIRQV